MGAPLHWTAAQAPRFRNYRAPLDGGTLCLDHPDARGRIGLRYEIARPADGELAACVARAVAPGPDTPERRWAQAQLGLQPRLGWFADTGLARHALDAVRHGSALPGLVTLARIGFRRWPRPDRTGTVQGFRWDGPDGERLTVLVGRDGLEVRHRRPGRQRRKILMRLAWSRKREGVRCPLIWPETLAGPRAGLALAAAVCAAARIGDVR